MTTQISARERLEAYMTHESDADADEYNRRLDAYRAEVLREATDEVDCLTRENCPVRAVTTLPGAWYDGLSVAVEKLRRMADEGGCTGECAPTTGAFKHGPRCPNQPATAAS